MCCGSDHQKIVQVENDSEAQGCLVCAVGGFRASRSVDMRENKDGYGVISSPGRTQGCQEASRVVVLCWGVKSLGRGGERAQPWTISVRAEARGPGFARCEQGSGACGSARAKRCG